MVSTSVLLLLLLVASATDIARHKIYNWNTYPGIAAGFFCRAWEHGWSGVADGLVGFLVCGSIMLVCFVLFNMGGGDVKLVAMLGAFLGLEDGVEAMLWTFVLGGVMGVAVLIWQIGIGRIVKKTAQHLWLVMRSRSWVPLTPKERKPLKRWLFLAPAALAAVCLVSWRTGIFK